MGAMNGALGNVLVNQDPPGAIQNSPSIVRDRATGNLVVAYTENPFAPVGIGASFSLGGVGPWSPSSFLPPASGWFGDQMDASVVADGAGFIYAGLASYDQFPPQGMRSGIFVHASVNGGVAFGAPSPVSLQIGPPGSRPFEIKPKIEVDDDATSSYFRRVYCAWERDITDWIHSDVCFSASPPGGSVWSPPLVVNDRPGLDFVLWPDPAVAPNGDVFVGWLDTPFMAQQQGFQGRIVVDRSTNGGANFGTDRVASTFWTVPTTLTDAIGQASYSAMSYPSVEVDPSNSSRVCAVYAARPASGPVSETRLDTGDQPPGSADVGIYSSFYGSSRMGAAGGWVYSVWEDGRSGIWDVYFDRTLSAAPTWPAGEVMLSTMTGGHTGSCQPVVAASGTDVWVAWFESAGPISKYIYLNRSADNGQSWLPTPISLDNLASQGAFCPVISASGSNVYVAWVATVNPGITSDIRVNRSTDGGVTWLANEIPLTGGVLALYHDIASSGSNVYAVWTQGSPGGGSEIRFRSSTNAGLTWTAPRRLDSAPPGAGGRWSPKVCCAGSSVYVAWHDQRAIGGGVNDIYFAYSTNAGASWSPDVSITGPGTSQNWYFHMACNGPDVYVAYASNRNNIPQGWDDIYLNSSTNGGQSWNGEVRLNGGTPPGTRQACYPRVSVTGSNVYVVWQDDRNGAPFSGWDIYGTHSINRGMTWPGADYRIDLGSPPGAAASWYPDITSDAAGAYYAWRDLRNGLGDVYANALQIGPDEADIFFVESLDGGTTWAPPLRVNDDNTPNDQTHPWLDIKPNGTVDVVWYDKRNDPNDRLVDVFFAALLPGTGAFQPNVQITTQSLAPTAWNWMGDYNGIEVDAPIAHMVWTDTRRDPLWGDIYYDNRPNPDVPQFGACCLPDGSCLVMDPSICAAAGGVFMGVDVPCEPTLCDGGSDVPGVPATDSGEMRILPSLPNPFSRSTQLRFVLPGNSAVTLDIHDASGRRVRHLLGGVAPAGTGQVIWDGRDDAGRRLPAGLYFTRLTGGGTAHSRPIVLVR
jgi:hypothetical protein